MQASNACDAVQTPVVPAISTLTTDYLIQLADLVAKTALLPGATAQLFDFGQAQLQVSPQISVMH